MRLGVFDPRSLSALFLCVAPFPFAGRNSTPRPHPIPHAKLSLVPSQIVKLVGSRLTTSTSKHPLRSSPQPYALPQKCTQRRPLEISTAEFEQVRDQVYSLFASTKRAKRGHLVRVYFPFPHNTLHPRQYDLHTASNLQYWRRYT
ncbi:hypothetical protein NA56DRAFT_451974 [Hyaloscypha hepaticicola]|uniref:Uncharacterized protein n=1 Tax=Hyaloscypha hepaticicola TaxID=2082293 RepID=A0A2J6PG68_9HELO|nr:hypothetical protein NA56DRAFT_451974 [Hyaloscypha hepaticicola]